jgi:hypothetical protein
MENLVLLIVCFGAGIALRQTGRMPDNAHVALNGFMESIRTCGATLSPAILAQCTAAERT